MSYNFPDPDDGPDPLETLSFAAQILACLGIAMAGFTYTVSTLFP